MVGRVLLVDDDPDARAFMRMSLERNGYEVAEAEDGVEALECLALGSFDVVVSDLTMPRMDGWSLVGAMRARDATRRIPVLLVSANMSGLELNDVPLLPKPATPAQLVRWVRRAADGHGNVVSLEDYRERKRRVGAPHGSS